MHPLCPETNGRCDKVVLFLINNIVWALAGRLPVLLHLTAKSRV
jgi:hypothetical protein